MYNNDVLTENVTCAVHLVIEWVYSVYFVFGELNEISVAPFALHATFSVRSGRDN